MDPATLLPYYNSHSFKLIREAYHQMLECHGDKNNVEVARWIKWHLKNNNDRTKGSSTVDSRDNQV